MDVTERLTRYLARKPDISAAAFVAPNATILGDVKLGAESSVWYGAILRADINSIRIGARSNLQDSVIVHLADDAGVEVGESTTVGHRAILHACRVGNESLIGMGAIVLDHADIGDRCIIGANTLVPQKMKVPAGSLVYGSPARIVRALEKSEQEKIGYWALKYIHVAAAHRARQSAG